MGRALEGVGLTTPGTDGERPNGVVLLSRAQGSTERELVTDWAARSYPGSPIVQDDAGAELVARLEGHSDPEVVPVRVTWVPRERSGDQRVSPRDLLALASPRRPPALLQPRIAAREPDRVHVIAGEGAHLSALRWRFREQAGTGGNDDALGDFIERQAEIALDRADRAIIGDRYKVPRLVAEQITATASFRSEIDLLAEKLGRRSDDVMREAVAGLNDLATVQSPVAVDAFRRLLSPMHVRAYDVEVDVDGLERLRELNRTYALIFLPSHRAYTDPLILADVLHDNDFPRNHVLGGNNLAFWPIGPIGKRAGLIFIRRSFGSDPVYKLAVREFFGYLVAKRFNIEWYIEGGRTRTGKLRPPKFGLLHYLAEALDRSSATDVMLVPVSINYSRLHEVAKTAAEQGGEKKSAEGISWLAGYMRAQLRRVGSVRIDFGDPISFRGALDDAGPGPAQLEKVAFRICDGINRVTPVTAPSLVAFALLGTPGRALTLTQVARVLAPAIDYVVAREIPGNVEAVRNGARLRQALDELVAAGVVDCYAGGEEPVWSIAPRNRMIAAFYRNAILHHFVDRAIVELALLHAARQPPDVDPMTAVWEHALRIRDLLKFEFFFADKETFRDQVIAELERIEPGSRQRSHSAADAGSLLGRSGMLVANRALRSFLDAQLVVADRLAALNPREAIDKPKFLSECLGFGRQLLLQGRLHSAESVSQELFSAALQLAANRDLVDPGREEVHDGRRAFYDEIQAVVAQIEEIRVLSEHLIEEALAE